MFYRDHEPAHFHAVYGEYEITVGIEDGVVRASFRAEPCGMFWNGTSLTSKRFSTIGSAQRIASRFSGFRHWSKT